MRVEGEAGEGEAGDEGAADAADGADGEDEGGGRDARTRERSREGEGNDRVKRRPRRW
jgi:hypothetical protein